MKPLEFTITSQDKKSNARTGTIKTHHGEIKTPYLTPVATRAKIISLTPQDIKDLGIQATLANTYHLHLRPGDEQINKQGGLHAVMDFHGPIFTDSGGFQAFSLGWGRLHNIKKIGFFSDTSKRKDSNMNESYAYIQENGVHFRSIYDPEQEYFIGPKESMQIQSNLGSDIIMAFDECTSPLHDKIYTERALQRTNRWALDCLEYKSPRQAIYGIIQGGHYKPLRIKSTQFISSHPFDGIAIGGSLGKSKKDMHKVLDWVIPSLDDRPRHLLGIGMIDDIFECVERGVDTFDCVDMTRRARHQNPYISPESGGKLSNKFVLDLKKGKYSNDTNPIDPNCECRTCENFSRSDLKKMTKEEYNRHATYHNVFFIENLMKQIRGSIQNQEFRYLKSHWLR